MVDGKIIEKLASDLEKYADAHSAYRSHMMKQATRAAMAKLSNSPEDAPQESKAEETCDHGLPLGEFCSECVPAKRNKKNKKKVASDMFTALAALAGFSSRGAGNVK